MTRRHTLALATAGLLAATSAFLGSDLAAPRVAGASPISDADIRRSIGDDVTRLPDGLYEVRLADGTRVHTHGPDPIGDHGTDMGPGDPERQPVCATDFYQHVLYGYLSSGTNQLAARRARILSSVNRMNYVLNEEAMSSGNMLADFKVRCDASQQVQIDAFSSPGGDFQTIMDAARAAGFLLPNADYTIFFDGTHPYACGIGTYERDERLDVNNVNNNGGGYAVTYYPDGPYFCWNNRTAMHENGHNQGAVQYNAPASTGSGAHCNDQIDVMCYQDGGDRNQTQVTLCSDRMHYDCNNDTYFDAAPESGEWLETHWNIGSPLNRFILFRPVTPRPRVAAYGHITITADGAGTRFTTTGVYADPTKFTCALSTNPLVQVTCDVRPNLDVIYECTHFILTATAPAPSNAAGSGNVSGRTTCDSGQTLATGDVVGRGSSQADNTVSGIDLGTANKVVCRAAGVSGGSNPSGSYQVDCYEPGVAWPFGKPLVP